MQLNVVDLYILNYEFCPIKQSKFEILGCKYIKLLFLTGHRVTLFCTINLGYSYQDEYRRWRMNMDEYARMNTDEYGKWRIKKDEYTMRSIEDVG